MANPLIQDWNNDPPPTSGFLKQLERWRAAFTLGDLDQEWEAYRALIDAIATREDLAQFLLEACDRVRCQDIENRTVDRYWDALSGVLVAKRDKAEPSSWRELARMLDKALYYE
jgi:hypothetical protein